MLTGGSREAWVSSTRRSANMKVITMLGDDVDHLLMGNDVRDVLYAIVTSEELNERERRSAQRALDAYDGKPQRDR